jgi:hypothetical protein
MAAAALPRCPRLIDALAVLWGEPVARMRQLCMLNPLACLVAPGSAGWDVAEFWEALDARGVTPGWASDARRLFEGPLECCGEESGPTCTCGGVPTYRHHPPTVADCLALASDPQGVATAETIAREVTGCERVVWRVVPRITARVGPAAPALDALGYAIDGVFGMQAVTLACPALVGGGRG